MLFFKKNPHVPTSQTFRLDACRIFVKEVTFKNKPLAMMPCLPVLFDNMTLLVKSLFSEQMYIWE